MDGTSQKNFNLSLVAKLRKLYLLALFRENDPFNQATSCFYWLIVINYELLIINYNISDDILLHIQICVYKVGIP
jgi:hypothetical protein